MAVTLLYFAWVRERIGAGEERITLDAPVALGELIDRLATKSAGHGQAFHDRPRLRAAINQTFCDWQAIVRDGDEVAIFPPVTGG